MMLDMRKRIVDLNTKTDSFELSSSFDANDVRYKNWVEERNKIYDILKTSKYNVIQFRFYDLILLFYT
jgi:hypothetical protein